MPGGQTPLRSSHTTGFPALLNELGASVLVTTYQAGKLVLLRADGGVLNTHFRGFDRPMGLAHVGSRVAIGTALEVWEYHDVPAVARLLPPAGRHDACFLPRSAVVTGDVAIHEMAFAADSELWFVNTRFSCLCTRSATHSFVPRWRPAFVSALAPEDRCHLNGLGLRDGQPRYVTMLGQTDVAGGWRADKKVGGLVMDITTGDVLVHGLSMPHSPRWHDGRLWLLESGAGTIGFVDHPAGRYQPVSVLPGFTRGLDFLGRFAFVGLSQVRESAVFSGIPITERPHERFCGVWVIDILSGETVAFVRFEDAVQEIFAVCVLSGVRFPDLVNDNRDLVADAFVLPDEALGVVPGSLRFPARPSLAGT